MCNFWPILNTQNRNKNAALYKAVDFVRLSVDLCQLIRFQARCDSFDKMLQATVSLSRYYAWLAKVNLLSVIILYASSSFESSQWVFFKLKVIRCCTPASLSHGCDNMVQRGSDFSVYAFRRSICSSSRRLDLQSYI